MNAYACVWNFQYGAVFGIVVADSEERAKEIAKENQEFDSINVMPYDKYKLLENKHDPVHLYPDEIIKIGTSKEMYINIGSYIE